MNDQVKKLLKWKEEKGHIDNQRSIDWKNKREELTSPSNYPTILGNNKYCSKNRLFHDLCGFRSNEKSDYVQNVLIKHGIDNEEVALEEYKKITGEKVHHFGCVKYSEIEWRDGEIYREFGGSPDGITESGKIIEIKCPVKREINYGHVPKNYIDQIQGYMFIFDLNECDYIEYKNGCELNIVNVKRDKKWEKKSIPKLLEFHEDVSKTKEMVSDMRECIKLCFISELEYIFEKTILPSSIKLLREDIMIEKNKWWCYRYSQLCKSYISEMKYEKYKIRRIQKKRKREPKCLIDI